MLGYEQRINDYNATHGSSLYVLANGMGIIFHIQIAIHSLIGNEIKRIQSTHKNSLIVLINCEEYLDMISSHSQVKITLLPSIGQRQEKYFEGGVIAASIRILSLDLFSIRLSPCIITEVIVIFRKNLIKNNSYVSLFLDYYLKENRVFFRFNS